MSNAAGIVSPAITGSPQTSSPAAQFAQETGSPPPRILKPTPDVTTAADVAKPSASAGETPATETAADPAIPAATAPVDKLARAREAAARISAQSKQAARARAERDALAVREQRATSEASAQREQFQRAQAQLDALRADPLKAIRDLGVTPQELARRAVEAGTPEAKIAALEAKIAEESAARVQLENRLQQAQQTERLAQAEVAITKEAANPRLYPHLSTALPSAILAEAKEIAWKAKAKGYTPENREILAYLEKRYARHQASRGGTQGNSASSPAAGATESTASRPSPRTISNTDASATWTKPANFDDMTDTEQRKHLAAMLRSRKRALGVE